MKNDLNKICLELVKSKNYKEYYVIKNSEIVVGDKMFVTRNMMISNLVKFLNENKINLFNFVVEKKNLFGKKI
jgi:hypothetical protein